MVECLTPATSDGLSQTWLAGTGALMSRSELLN